jgi:hypothetical protein
VTDITQHLKVPNLQFHYKKQSFSNGGWLIDFSHITLQIFRSALGRNGLLNFPTCQKLPEEDLLAFVEYTEITDEFSLEFNF